MEDVSEGDPAVSEVQVRRPGEGRVTGSQERTPERSLPASAGAAAVRAPFAGVARPACLLGGTCSQGWQRAAPLGILFRMGTARRPLSRTRPLRRLASSPEHTPLLLPRCPPSLCLSQSLTCGDLELEASTPPRTGGGSVWVCPSVLLIRVAETRRQVLRGPSPLPLQHVPGVRASPGRFLGPACLLADRVLTPPSPVGFGPPQ